jgi:DNA polymerase-3 subunit alpha
LHTHSHFSLLDCTATLENLVKAARDAGMKALAVTDHGNMFGAVEFYEKALQAGIKPIIGYEAYVAPDSRHSRQARGISDASFHLTLLARNLTGYRNLMHLATVAYTEGFYYRPRIDKEVLASHHEGLVCLSGCIAGELPHYLLVEDEARAVETAAFYKELFGEGHFFVEIQDHGIADQRRILPGLVKVAKKLGVGLAATNDNHYIRKDDWEAHDALLCINTGKLVSDQNRLRFQTQEFYFKSDAEMRSLFPDWPEAIENTARIGEMCNLELRFDELHFPRVTPPGGLTPEEYLRQLATEGFERRYGRNATAARARLEKELAVICRMGFASYFIIVSDFVRFAKEENVPVGPGRGSAAGSVVSYCLGITNIDPLAYDLLFERFLDESRREMPDIDIDFCQEKRDRVIDYVKKKYGEDRVAQIITFGTMAAKGVVRDVGRVLGIRLTDVNRLCSLIPPALGTTLESAFEAEPELKRTADSDPQIARLFQIARRLEGLARHPSVHAAGVVIADKPLEEYVPLYATDGERITQYPMDDLPKVGLLKMDFLGLKTLSIIRRASEFIEADHGVKIDIDAIPLDDKKTFDLLSRGESLGVFQFESTGIRDLLRRLKPDKFSDLIACVALYRPGPLGGGMVDDFVMRKHGKAEISYKHQLLEPILKDTYGVMAYQEQVMQILNRLGSMTMSDAYTLIKAISKKKSDVIEARREAFVKGAKGNGVSDKIASEIFDLITFFGGYGFNKSHSTAYALISYQTAYLKANWPVDFYAATFTFEMGNTDKLIGFIKDAERSGIKILPPDVNESFGDFRPVKGARGKWAIRYGLAALKGVGEKAVEAIVAARDKAGKFRSIFHLTESVDVHQVNKSVMEALVKSGGMDGLGARRAQMAAVVQESLDAGARAQADQKQGQSTFFAALGDFEKTADSASMPDIPEWNGAQLLSGEKEALGFYMSSNPLAEHEGVIARYITAPLGGLPTLADGQEIIAGGIVSAIKPTTTKNGRNRGEKMATFVLTDINSATVQAVIFPGEYRAYKDLVVNDAVLLVRGRLDLSREVPNVKVSEVIPIDQADAKLARRMLVTLSAAGISDDLLKSVVSVIRKHPGRVSVFFRVETPEAKVLLAAGGDFTVAPTAKLVADCERLLGEGHVTFTNGHKNGNGSNGQRRSAPEGVAGEVLEEASPEPYI